MPRIPPARETMAINAPSHASTLVAEGQNSRQRGQLGTGGRWVSAAALGISRTGRGGMVEVTKEESAETGQNGSGRMAALGASHHRPLHSWTSSDSSSSSSASSGPSFCMSSSFQSSPATPPAVPFEKT